MKNDFIKNNNKNKVVKKPKKSRVLLAFTLIFLWTIGAIAGIVSFFNSVACSKTAYADTVSTANISNFTDYVLDTKKVNFVKYTNSLIYPLDTSLNSLFNLPAVVSLGSVQSSFESGFIIDSFSISDTDSFLPVYLLNYSFWDTYYNSYSDTLKNNLGYISSFTVLKSDNSISNVSTLTNSFFDFGDSLRYLIPNFPLNPVSDRYFNYFRIPYINALGSNIETDIDSSMYSFFFIGFDFGNDIRNADYVNLITFSAYTLPFSWFSNTGEFTTGYPAPTPKTTSGTKITYTFNSGMIFNVYVSLTYASDFSIVVADSNNAYYDSGYNAGYRDGVATNSGYNEGYNVGSRIGYQNGYVAGVSSSQNYTFLGLMGSIFDAPIKAFTSLFDFDVLGVNMSSFLLSFFSVCIVITVVKYLL